MPSHSDQFHLVALDPHSWLAQAEEHIYAAAVIAKHFDTIARKPSSQMGIRIAKLACIKSLSLLLAFALENAFKALVVASTPEVGRNGGRRPRQCTRKV
jgi:hypothetical protein